MKPKWICGTLCPCLVLKANKAAVITERRIAAVRPSGPAGAEPVIRLHTGSCAAPSLCVRQRNVAINTFGQWSQSGEHAVPYDTHVQPLIFTELPSFLSRGESG